MNSQHNHPTGLSLTPRMDLGERLASTLSALQSGRWRRPLAIGLAAWCLAGCDDPSEVPVTPTVSPIDLSTCDYPLTCEGDQIIESESDLDEIRGCHRITGSLYIVDQTWLDAIDLPCLNTVETAIVVSGAPNLTDLQGLSQLSDVGQSVALVATGIVDLVGLSQLRTGGVTLIENPNLTSLDGLASMVSEQFSIGLWDNPALSDLSGLSGLESLRSLSIGNSESLTSLDALSSLKTVEFLTLSNNNNLTNLWGLGGLKSIRDTAIIAHNDSLETLSGLGSVSTVESLSIYDNQHLGSLEGLDKVEHVGSRLAIQDNPELASLEHLAALATVNGDLYVEDNPSLESLEGLDELEFVEALYVRRNSNLQDVSGLFGLEAAGWLTITDNPQLCQYHAEDVVSTVPVSGTTIESNYGACD